MATIYKNINMLLALALILFVFACGTKSATPIKVTIIVAAGEPDPFAEGSGVSDIIYIIHDHTDISRSSLYYPQKCVTGSSVFPVGCGFKKNDVVNLKLCFEECTNPPSGAFIPPEHEAQIHFCARDASGNVLFWGDSEVFTNDPALKEQAVTLTVAQNTGSRTDCQY